MNDYRSPFAPPEQDDAPTTATADASDAAATPVDAEVIPPAVAPIPARQPAEEDAEKPAERRASSTRRRARRKPADAPTEDLDAALAKLDAARGKGDE